MAQLFAKQVGLFNEEGKAEFMVRNLGDGLLEGVRVVATSEEDAKKVFVDQVHEMLSRVDL